MSETFVSTAFLGDSFVSVSKRHGGKNRRIVEDCEGGHAIPAVGSCVTRIRKRLGGPAPRVVVVVGRSPTI
jgi:hypothetical protein